VTGIYVEPITSCDWYYVVDDDEWKSSGVLDSLEVLGKSVLEQSLVGVTTIADWKTQPSAVTLVVTLAFIVYVIIHSFIHSFIHSLYVNKIRDIIIIYNNQCR